VGVTLKENKRENGLPAHHPDKSPPPQQWFIIIRQKGNMPTCRRPAYPGETWAQGRISCRDPVLPRKQGAKDRDAIEKTPRLNRLKWESTKEERAEGKSCSARGNTAGAPHATPTEPSSPILRNPNATTRRSGPHTPCARQPNRSTGKAE